MASPWGGSWSNAEDQVLLTACAKYGVGTSWARISSLIPRKTAKQCKARYELYLNPTIKKTEWTREEDERLLHMTKAFPAGQWATVAVMMDGRTQYQCQERYNKLLDEEAAREQKELGDGLLPVEAAPNAEDVRRLQPGEVDVQAESRPAKPDSEHMDEVDLEMMQEARARMANTKGKKAKRKERERRTKLAHQMAKMGKRRELQMSGINIKLKTVKKGEMDYNADIPFERAPAPGFHDTTEEIEQNEREREGFDPRKQQLANNNKRKGEEQDEDEEFRKKRKENKNDQQGPSAAALNAARMQKIREAEQSSNRRPLVLPAPQVSDYELDDIVKAGMADQHATDAALAGDNVATRGLVSQYGGTAGATPMQTPFRTAGPMATPLRQDLSRGEQRGPQSALNRLASLPKPQATGWEFEMPEEQDEVAETTNTPEDAAVRDAREKAAREAAEKEAFAQETLVVQKRLPRPSVVSYGELARQAEAMEDSTRRAIALETAKVIAFDAIKHGGAQVMGNVPDDFVPMTNEARAKVRKEVLTECAKMDKERGMSREETIQKIAELHEKNMKIPGLDSYSDDEDVDELQLLKDTHTKVLDHIQETAKKNNELEARLDKYHGGYIARNKMLRGKISEAFETLEKLDIQLDTAKHAQVREEVAINRRLEKMKEEVRVVKAREMEAQEEYRRVKAEWDALQAARAAAAAQTNGTD